MKWNWSDNSERVIDRCKLSKLYCSKENKFFMID